MLGKEASVKEALELMKKKNTSTIVIGEKKAEGIVHQHRIHQLLHEKKIDPETTPLQKVMEEAVVMEEPALIEVIKTMSKKDTSTIIITKKEDLIGIIKAEDVIKLLSK